MASAQSSHIHRKAQILVLSVNRVYNDTEFENATLDNARRDSSAKQLNSSPISPS